MTGDGHLTINNYFTGDEKCQNTASESSLKGSAEMVEQSVEQFCSDANIVVQSAVGLMAVPTKIFTMDAA